MQGLYNFVATIITHLGGDIVFIGGDPLILGVLYMYAYTLFKLITLKNTLNRNNTHFRTTYRHIILKDMFFF